MASSLRQQLQDRQAALVHALVQKTFSFQAGLGNMLLPCINSRHKLMHATFYARADW